VSSSSPVHGTIVPPSLRNPYIDGKIAHPTEYMWRRFLNWFPLGLAYAMLYMGRYNLTVAKGALGPLMTKEDFGLIFGIGTWVYGIAFVLNGPLTDRIGGKRAMLAGLLGAFVANVGMGLYVQWVLKAGGTATAGLTTMMSVLYGLNMYFQSFGAVAIVKVNASWFHVRERGSFSGIFGIMISSGIWFAYSVNRRLLGFVGGDKPGPEDAYIVFLVPAVLLGLFFVIELVLLRDAPSDAGHYDIETGEAVSDEEHAPSMFGVLLRILTNPIIMIVALIEFCTGVLRQGIMQWYYIYATEQTTWFGVDETLSAADMAGFSFSLVYWGEILAIAGIIGGTVAGFVSDKVFQSRRAPAAGLLYGLVTASTLVMYFTLQQAWILVVLVFLISLGVIGTHGLLSGTATMDFGGRKGAATAVGVIDGFVYLGSGLQALAIGQITTHYGWRWWPMFLFPFGMIGLFLLTRIWHAMPKGKKAGGH
jgi:MFS transporter, OPA family, glycerol-3-phosphate transporter